MIFLNLSGACRSLKRVNNAALNRDCPPATFICAGGDSSKQEKIPTVGNGYLAQLTSRHRVECLLFSRNAILKTAIEDRNGFLSDIHVYKLLPRGRRNRATSDLQIQLYKLNLGQKRGRETSNAWMYVIFGSTCLHSFHSLVRDTENE